MNARCQDRLISHIAPVIGSTIIFYMCCDVNLVYSSETGSDNTRKGSKLLFVYYMVHRV